jgi:Domain of unknown function (DUF892)
MKSRVEEIHDLEALYFKQLRLLLSAEEVIAVKTPFFTDRAQDLQLKQVLRRQSEEGEAHAARLRDILGRSGSASTPVKCEAIYALFHEVEELVFHSISTTPGSPSSSEIDGGISPLSLPAGQCNWQWNFRQCWFTEWMVERDLICKWPARRMARSP